MPHSICSPSDPMNFDTYQTERKVIEHAEAVLARSDAAD